MILTWAVVLGLLASLVRYRSEAFAQVAAMPVRGGWMALGAVALQIPLLCASTGTVQELAVPRALFLASHLLLIVFVWFNRRLLGMPLIGLGVICNLAVIALNGGFMPITPETLIRINPGTGLAHWPVGYHYGSSKDIILPRMAIRLWGLSDILVVPPPFPWPTAFSVGDLLIAAGIVVLLLNPRSRPDREEAQAGTDLMGLLFLRKEKT